MLSLKVDLKVFFLLHGLKEAKNWKKTSILGHSSVVLRYHMKIRLIFWGKSNYFFWGEKFNLERSFRLISCFLKPCKKALVTEQDQTRGSRFSGLVLQMVQKLSSRKPILLKKLFVDSLLWKSLNLKTINLVILVHWKDSLYVALQSKGFIISKLIYSCILVSSE